MLKRVQFVREPLDSRRRPHHQLSFPGWNVPLKAVHTEDLRGADDVQVEVRTGHQEVQLVLRVLPCRRTRGDYWYRDASFDIRLQLTDAPRCLVKGESSSWNMLADDEPDGPFSLAIAWALEYLEPDTDRYDESSVTRVLRYSQALDRANRMVASWAVELCDPCAHERALKFSPSARMFVYAAIVADESGRIAQLVDICPGVLVLVSEDEPCADHVLAGVRSGRPLASLLQEAVANLLPRADRDAIVFVRRAPAQLSRSTLVRTIAAPGVDINDMPGSVNDLLTWFDWQVESDRVARYFFAPDRIRFGSFVSKHALALEAIVEERPGDRSTLIAEVVDWARSRDGIIPARASTPVRVMASIDAWHARLWVGGDYDPNLTLPEPPTASGEVPDVVVEPIRTTGELFMEGRKMNHCVASFAYQALAGQIFFYRGTVRGERLTIAVEWSDDRCRLVQAFGFANRRPMALGAIHRWIESLEMPSSRASMQASPPATS